MFGMDFPLPGKLGFAEAVQSQEAIVVAATTEIPSRSIICLGTGHTATTGPTEGI